MWEKRQLKQRQEEKLQKGAGPIPAEKPEKNKEKTPGSGSPESAVGSAHQLGRRKLVKFQEDGVGSPEKDPAASPGKKGAQLPERKAKSRCWVFLRGMFWEKGLGSVGKTQCEAAVGIPSLEIFPGNVGSKGGRGGCGEIPPGMLHPVLVVPTG